MVPALIPAAGSKSKLGDIRIKLKYVVEEVLPLEAYREFIDVMMEPDMTICKTLMGIKLVKYDVAAVLVGSFYGLGKIDLLVRALTSVEVANTGTLSVCCHDNQNMPDYYSAAIH